MSQLLSKVLSKDNIVTQLETESKDQAIKRAGSLLTNSGFVEGAYVEKMLEREAITTTFIGSGLAIPHGTKEGKDYVKKTGIVFLQYPQGVDFGNGNIAYLVIGIAALGDEHMDILMNVAEAVSDAEDLEILKNTSDVDQIYTLLSQSN